MRSSLILFATLAALLAAAHPGSAQTVTELLRSGPNASKLNLVILGDGFDTNDQGTFDNRVEQVVLRGVFSETRRGVFRETMNAFNIFRVNAVSAQSGITTVDAQGNVTNNVDTFFGYRYSGIWNRCWMEPGPNTNATLNSTLNSLVPGWDFAFVILNTTSGGGCRRGNTLAITMSSAWSTAAHEMGHMVGNLGDEYTGTANYTGAEPGNVNLTINTNRNTLKWRQFVSPATDVPTDPATFTGSAFDTAGLFEGATTNMTRYGTGIYRPARNARMNSNVPPFCPVCYDQIQNAVFAEHEYDFRNLYVGRFTRDDRTDVMLHNANSIALHSGEWDRVDIRWVRTLPDPVWDAYRRHDRFFVGDFDGDGLDDLFVFNIRDWAMPYFAMIRSTGEGFEGVRRFDRNLPGWGAMTEHDEFHVADFDGDGRDDIVVLNTRDFSIGYLLMLQSTGNDLRFVRRYDEELPGWDDMKPADRLFVADFDGDRKDDLYVFNGEDWSVGYLGMLRSHGSGYGMVRRYDEELPGWDDMKKHDQFHVADFDGNDRDDLYVFNGRDWSMCYLQMLRSGGASLANARRYDGSVPGWGEMRRNDRWYPADVDGNHRDDVYVYNASDWSTEYLGTLRSSGSSLNGGWQAGWIGSWNLGKVDRLLVGNFNGGAGWDDLFVYNDDWFGLLRSFSGSSGLSAIYPDWIHNHEYHSQGWW
jgi:hypothetical protein